jgi:glycosyltransferase involved in cell wall biosynthesis
MKILHITASMSSDWGGPPKVVQELTEDLVKKGNEVSIFTPIKKRESNLICPKGVKMKTFKESFFSRIWGGHSFCFKKGLEKEIKKFDIIHINETWHYPHFVAYRLAKKYKKPFIITPHGTLEPWCLNYKSFKKKIFSFLIQRRILNQASAIQALTQKEAKNIKKFGADNYIEVIPNGINIEEFNDLSPYIDLENEYPQLKNKKIILFLGRIHPIKGLDILAQAFGNVAKNRDDIRLLIVGLDNDGYQKEIEKILKKEKVLDKVIFTGALLGKEKLAAFRRSNIFVLPSYSEGFGRATLEAMFCGLPVIVSDQCDFFLNETEDNVGLIINLDIDELVRAIIKLLENPVLSKEMSQNGRKLAREKYTWDKITDKIIDLYKKVLNEQERKK